MKQTASQKQNRKDKFEKLTQQIIEKMEQGVNPWVKPWRQLKQTATAESLKNFAFNYITNKAYSRFNQLGLKAGYYMTFKQVKSLGGNVKKGATAQWVAFTDTHKRKATDDEIEQALGLLNEQEIEFEIGKYYNIWGFGTIIFNSETDAIMLKYITKEYTVFHLDDCENYRPIKRNLTAKPANENPLFNNNAIDEIINNYVERENISFYNETASDRAYFSPWLDKVVIPMKSQYKHIEEYYATAFHELTHSTGTEKRLNRSGFENITHFGDESYTKEELVAEMGASFAIGYLELDASKTLLNSVAYLKSWVSHLKGDLSKHIMLASNQASQAFEYIFNLEKSL